MISNPFITIGYESPEYFCDRKEETQELIRLLTNGNNVALISPRRIGKTGLMYHCFAQSQMENYYTFIVDIYATKNLNEFVFEFGRTILSSLKSRERKLIDRFVDIVKSLRTGISFDQFGTPSWNIELGEIQTPSITLDEIFEYLESANQECIVAIDEFQSISNYPEKNIEALLRTYVQRCRNTHFIFSGSQRSMMREMFLSPARPFYQSVSTISLSVISENSYTEFANHLFAKYNKHITNEAIEYVYNKFEGITWYLQKVMNELFSTTTEGGQCGIDDVEPAISHILKLNEDLYADTLYQLSIRQKELLYAISRENKANQITSAKFIKRYHLNSASSVQKATAVLLEKQLITNDNGVYQVYDRLFHLWLNRH